MMAEKVTKKVKKEKIPRVSMPEQEPEIRARNFLEVPTGYTEEMAMTEAQRCLQCKKPASRRFAAGSVPRKFSVKACASLPKKGIRSPSVTWKGSQPTGKEKMVPGRYPQQPSPPGKELLSLVPVLPV
jgi:hypothetical protein